MPFAVIAMLSLSAVFPEGGDITPWVALLTWFIPWIYLARSLTKLPCPRCGKPAIAHPFFFMRHAACQRCGLRPAPTDV